MSHKPVPRGTSKRTQAKSLGYELIAGKARRYRNLRTGETISYNAFRRLASKYSQPYATKMRRFDTLLARTNNLEQAKRESGISGRQLATYRHQMAERNISPFGRSGFRGVRGKDLPFLNIQGQWDHATFSGVNSIAMHDYKRAAYDNPGYTAASQAELDRWEKAHLNGVVDDEGRTHHLETDLSRIRASMRRMSKRTKANLHKQLFYATKYAA
jgi:hypothetical protein